MIETIIDRNRSMRDAGSDLWRHRELFFFLAWRDLLVRYKQTTIGVDGAVITPVLTMVILTGVFGRLAGLPSGELPYMILVFAAILPWQFFSSTFSTSSISLLANSAMVSKVYFPRLIIPSASMVVSLADLLISFGILACLMAWYGVEPSLRLFAIFPLISYRTPTKRWSSAESGRCFRAVWYSVRASSRRPLDCSRAASCW